MKFSTEARPPIQAHEAAIAKPAICPRHNGLIGRMPAGTDKIGNVYLCPVGREFWRYNPNGGDGMNTPLNYPKQGMV